ncbi:helix-turn-helix domain-containing protein [Streptomyces chartreusis]|uniref:helix-turn-helix domain-containing protein n=1 Tax=Streptomyces chartreusis TaxID=1969 RepID=UPI00380B9811
MPADDDSTPEWLTRTQFADLLQVHVGTVSRWITSDTGMRVKRLGPNGHRVRIHRSELDRDRSAEPQEGTP